jgi:hypothetical protein
MPAADRRSRAAASVAALFAGATAWLSAGTLALTSGHADRVAALPSFTVLGVLMLAALAAAWVGRLRGDHAWPLALCALLWLPFLPGRIPPAFLIWQGPLEALVWVTVAAGLAGSRWGAARPVLVHPARAPWIAALLVAVVSLVAFVGARPVVPGGDEPHYLVATQSLLADADLKVANNYEQGDYLAYFGGRLQPHFLQRSAAGEVYSIHSPGVSALVLPAFAAAGYLGAVLTMVLAAALTAALAWATAWRLSGSAAGAWIGVLAVFLTPPFVFHTFTIYPDGAGALMVMCGVWLLVRLQDAWAPSSTVLAGVGAALAVLPWLHTRFALLAVALGACVIARLIARPGAAGRVAVFLAAPVVAAVAWFGYFWVIWGTPNPMAPYGRDMETSMAYIGRGLTGLLIDQQFGVLATAPVLAAALVGVWQLVRTRTRLAAELLIVVVPYMVSVSTYAMWWGGSSAPARFLAAVLPMATVLVALAWRELRWTRLVTLVLLLVSVAASVPRIAVEGGRFLFNGRSTFDATVEWLSRSVDLPLGLPSVHRDALLAWRDAAPWLIALVVLGVVSALLTRERGRARAWTVAVMAAALGAMLSTTAVWAFHGSAAVTPDRSVLAALHAHRPWHTVHLDARRWQPVAPGEFLRRLELHAAASGGAVLLRAARVPAGDYDILTAAAAPDGRLAVTVGRNDPPIESATLQGGEPFRLRLPVPVASLSVRADTSAGEGARALRLRPAGFAAPAGDGRAAVRAARYGGVRVFVFDERAYLEPTGFWTRAEGRATVVMDASPERRASGLPVDVTAGAAATTIGISVGHWSQSLSLTPGERRTVLLPPLQGATDAWVVQIHSGPGFRPSEREPGNADVRALAAWFEIP